MSTALLDDAVNGGESEAGAVADFLGGEEGLEDVALSFLVHALTVVAEGEADVLSVRQAHGEPRAAFDVGGFDGQDTARRHGIAGIDGAIYEDLVLREGPSEPRAAFDVGGFDGQDTARRHGIAGIDGEIDEDLVHLPGVSENGPQPVAKH